MKKIITMALISIPMLFSSNILAEGFNDNYLQVGYATSDYKFVDEIMDLKGSVEINNFETVNTSFSKFLLIMKKIGAKYEIKK